MVGGFFGEAVDNRLIFVDKFVIIDNRKRLKERSIICQSEHINHINDSDTRRTAFWCVWRRGTAARYWPDAVPRVVRS
jgi:hypothetical protein